ncbi:uncharacterized protein VTP21DRAFT_10307 [Calcarisporiella thermophila]|uniref:uncharacterized protein n=1 Tax=Calcarisporiella thermophila TaxID=911321 RepID=UPI0037420CFB
MSIAQKSELATFAAGCFWGVQRIFDKHFSHAITQTRVGYIGGNTEAPGYKQVCSGTTNHAEALEIAFDPTRTTYADLVEFFYRMHDPTTLNHQGPDIGTQYRSAIFYHSDQQRQVAERVTNEVQEKHYKNKKIVTQLLPAGKFWDAEEYHQKYLEKNPNGYECPTHFLRW